jgi:hypothetical protein
MIGCFSGIATVTCVRFYNIKFFKLSFKDVCPLLNLLIETTDLLLNLKLLNHAEVKNAWSYTSPPQYASLAWCSFKKVQGHIYIYLFETLFFKLCYDSILKSGLETSFNPLTLLHILGKTVYCFWKKLTYSLLSIDWI